MKNLLRIVWLIGLLGWLSLNTVRAADTTSLPVLEIYNDWDYTVHVKEGRFFVTNKDIAANDSYSTTMSTHISNLEISYKPDNSGNWVPIKGCSRGTYATTLGGISAGGGGANLKVYITGKDSDSRVPVCRSEVFD